jgi:hypothetical protein
MQQLVQLLDVLPYTKQLGYLLVGTCWPLQWLDIAEVQHIAQGDTWGEGATKAAMGRAVTQQHAACVYHSSSTTTTNSSSSSAALSSNTTISYSSSVAHADTAVPWAGAGGSWRSSCHSLLVRCPGEDAGVGVNTLQPLFEALRRPQLLYLHGGGLGVWRLPRCAPLLQPLRALHLCGVRNVTYRGLEAVATLTNLRHLGVTSIRCTHLPVPFSSMVHLTSLDLRDTCITGEGLEGVCDAPALRQLDLTDCSDCSYLPDAISRLTGLESLILHKAPVAHLPEGVTAWGRLQNLAWTPRIPNCPALDTVWRLTSLRSLTLNVVGDPALMNHLSARRVMSLYGGWLAAAPEGVTQLTGLVHSQLDAWWVEWPLDEFGFRPAIAG